MNRLLLLIALMIASVGCAKDSHEQVTREYLDVMRQLLKVCNSLCDQVSVESTDSEADQQDPKGNENTVEDSKMDDAEEKTSAAKEKIGNLLTELKELKKRLEELGDVDQSTREKISKKYKSEFESLTQQFSDTINRIKKQEDVAAALESELKTLASLLNAKVS